MEVLKQNFYEGSPTSIMDLTANNGLALLFGWYNNGEKCAAEVRDYLRTEIEKKPVRLGRLAVWFFPYEHVVASNKDALLKLINVETITELLDQFREKAWSTEEEKGAVERLRELLQ